MTRYVSVRDWFMCEKFVNPKYRHVDGIGTKGFYHWRAKSFHAAVKDAIAMNLNDLALARAIPYEITDHIILPEDDHNAFITIVEHLAEECILRDIAITGGESSVHTTQEGLEISISMSGFVARQERNNARADDILIGIQSSGLHSNGFTKVRELFGDDIRDEFTVPTNIYLDLVRVICQKEMLENRKIINGMIHVTGGAYTKIKNMLLDKDAVITSAHSLLPQPIFYEIHEKGVSCEDIYMIFNCGIGFVMSVSKWNAEYCLATIRNSGKNADIIGEIREGRGNIKIQSMFSKKEIVL